VSASCLIGYSGFIGGNLAKQYAFRDCYRSANIDQIRGRSYDTLVCSGVSAMKWWANRFPADDREAIDRLLENLTSVRAERAVLISTVDVYPLSQGLDESFDPHGRTNHAYGTNRLYVEDTMRQLFSQLHIVRLPAMFGPGLKKNVIYDLIHDNCLEAIHPDSAFQYYDVRRLWEDLQVVFRDNLPLVNFTTEPIATRKIVERYFPGKPIGAQAECAATYDLRTRFAEHFGGRQGYVFSAERVLSRLGDWLHHYRQG
jgi:hypothetical protein